MGKDCFEVIICAIDCLISYNVLLQHHLPLLNLDFEPEQLETIHRHT